MSRKGSLAGLTGMAWLDGIARRGGWEDYADFFGSDAWGGPSRGGNLS